MSKTTTITSNGDGTIRIECDGFVIPRATARPAGNMQFASDLSSARVAYIKEPLPPEALQSLDWQAGDLVPMTDLSSLIVQRPGFTYEVHEVVWLAELGVGDGGGMGNEFHVKEAHEFGTQDEAKAYFASRPDVTCNPYGRYSWDRPYGVARICRDTRIVKVLP